MGVILDSSVVIAAERRGERAAQFLVNVAATVGDQEAGLSSIGLTELVHGIYRARSEKSRIQRVTFIDDLASALSVYPYTEETARLAGRIQAREMASGRIIPFADLLIGSTALSLGFSILTLNVRHFEMIPGLDVISI